MPPGTHYDGTRMILCPSSHPCQTGCRLPHTLVGWGPLQQNIDAHSKPPFKNCPPLYKPFMVVMIKKLAVYSCMGCLTPRDLTNASISETLRSLQLISPSEVPENQKVDD